jgi:hypothetical protein
MDASQMVHGSRTGVFSILSSLKPVHLDLNITRDLVHMRGRGGGGPKLGGAAASPGYCTALYNQAPAAQWAATPQRLSSANHGDPTVWHHQRIYHPNGSFRPNGYSVVMDSSVRESAFAGLQATFRPDMDSLCMSDGEIWTAHGDVNPCGLVVRRGRV